MTGISVELGASAIRSAWVWRLRLGAIAAVLFTVALTGAARASAEVTGASENLRTGWYPDEASLTPALVGGGQFERVFERQLKGQIYAQPLTANGTLLVLTEENWAYGLDPVTGAVRWEKQFGTAVEAGENKTINCTDLEPRVGITGTPVIDTDHNIAYFVSNRYVTGGSGAIAWYMHAIKLDTGEDVFTPVKIEGQARNLPGVTFEAGQELQRPALLLMNGVVYAAFGSHCDQEPYAGWIVGVSSSGQLRTMWATSGHGASIWQAGGGLISDGPGQILFTTGNAFSSEPGKWDPPEGTTGKQSPPAGKLGESVVRVEVQPSGELETTDYFSPFNDEILDEADLDLGSSAPVGLPSQFGAPGLPHLLVQEGKEGRVYLLNRDGLGGRGTGANNIVQELGPYGGVWGTAAVWPGEGYVDIPSVSAPKPKAETSNSLRFFKYSVNETGRPALSLAATTPDQMWFGSGSPVITSDGTASGTGVLWVTWCPTQFCNGAELRAYSASSSGAPKPFWKEGIGSAAKFSRPDASSGHIYVGNREGRIIAFAGPLTPSTRSLALGSTVVGGQLRGQVTFTNTGTKALTVSSVNSPSAPFAASGLPAAGTVIGRGQVITVEVVFQPSSPGSFGGSLGFTTQAGQVVVSLSGSATAPAPAGTLTTASLVTTQGAPAATAASEPMPKLTKLKIRASASRLRSHRRKLVISYTLSAPAKVAVIVYRRVISHRCRPGVHSCVHWIATRIRLKVGGHKGTNVLSVNLGTLSAGEYRLGATPIARSGAVGVTRYVYFKAGR